MRELLPDRERRQPGFRWLIHLGVPLSASLLIHALLLTVIALRSWQVFGGASNVDLNEYEVAISDAGAAEVSEGLKWPGEHTIDLDETAAIAADVDPFDFSALSEHASLDDLAAAAPLLNPGEIGDGGFGVGESGRSGVLGIGAGAGEGGGGGAGAGFGVGTGIGKAAVWNVNASGARFAYVVDFSGSIIVAVDELKRELKRSIGTLSSRQSFAVYIFYSTGEAAAQVRTEAFSPRLQPATPEAKKQVFDWLDRKSPRGSTEPLQAMKRALALHPDAVFFFSDGYFEDKVVNQVALANRDVHAQIHCLVFDELLLADNSGPPRLTDGARRLKRIADAAGGKTKIVSGADLNW
jgi:hypothetical protein